MTPAPATAGPPGAAADFVLSAEHISVEYSGAAPVRAVRDVSLELRRGEVLGIVGESGCGKSTLAYALARLLRPPARLSSGTVRFYGRDRNEPVDIMALDAPALRRFRWSKVSMVFQSAMNALNPVISLRRQFADIFAEHAPEMDAAARERRSRELLEMVGISGDRIRSYPHELSGGMRQRVVIAMALALRPEIVIMDEPTTALDVVVQQEILDEIEQLKEEIGFSIIFITHDLSLLLDISDRLAVMYAGEIVEYGPADHVAARPSHPYTYALLNSFPELRAERRQLRGVPGTPPDLQATIPGCAFAPRCDFAFELCTTRHPRPRPPYGFAGPAGSWTVACHLHDPELRPDGPPAEIARSGPRPATTVADRED